MRALGVVPTIGALQQPNEIGGVQRLTATSRIDTGRQQALRRFVSGASPLGEGIAQWAAWFRNYSHSVQDQTVLHR